MRALSLLVILLSVATVQAAAVYDTEAAFQSNIAAGYYLEDFDTLAGGSSWVAPGANGYGFEAMADFGIARREEGYPSAPSIMPSMVDQTLAIYFTGAAVTALGGYFNNTRPAQLNIITLSDGTVEQFPGFGFRGFTSDVPITSLLFVGDDNPSYGYGWLDHLYVGAKVPEPASLILLGLAGLLLRRR